MTMFNLFTFSKRLSSIYNLVDGVISLQASSIVGIESHFNNVKKRYKFH